ncbi:toll/interleukin-1 receptor domain-containing protein [Amycolatopsis azurea]|uniref:toll/interleukin-1 receptor domain-containing protein n=1 Tax=Amycolatopsis azurea TaxID=36819 RepID=UPI0038226DAB
MSMFVSYSRADNSLEKLASLRARLAGNAEVYVDDLDWAAAGPDRTETVYHALARASVFVAVVSATYRKTAWTAWEFDVATSRGIPKLAYLPDGRLVDERSDEWPFASQAGSERVQPALPSAHEMSNCVVAGAAHVVPEPPHA